MVGVVGPSLGSSLTVGSMENAITPWGIGVLVERVDVFFAFVL